MSNPPLPAALAVAKAKRKRPAKKSRKAAHSARAIGLAGFDFAALNHQYSGSATPINDADSYGVAIQPATVAAGATYWKAVGIHHLTPDENRSRHNIFLDVLNESGERVREALIGWTWEGNQEAPPPKRLDKPDSEPGADIPIFDGLLRVWVQGSEPSDTVTGLHYRHADERNSAGEILNSHGHHSFYVVFQRVRHTSATGPSEGGGEVITPVTDGQVTITPSVTGRIRAAEKLGIDANRPIDPSTGIIAAQVADPAIIAETGVGWVRLNFVMGQPWHGPDDQNRPQGLTWAESYRRIIDGLRSRGLRIYGLISAEAMHEEPGEQFRDPIDGPLANDWIARYADTFTRIAELFHAEVDYFESFNEPDDWHGSNRNWVHPTWFALILQELHQRVRNHPNPAVRAIRLVSGPLQGLHNDDSNNNGNAGARYLSAVYQAGKRFFGWGNGVVPFPFDGVGYHLYVAQSAANANQDIERVYHHYRDEVSQVIRTEEGRDKLIYLSEFGWQSSVVGESRQVDCMDFGTRLIVQDPAIALGFWFCTQDFAEKFGLYREGALSPDSRKPIYHAFQSFCASTIEILSATPTIIAATGATPPRVQWIGIVTAELLNVRSGPAVDQALVGSLVNASQVQVIEQIGDWLRIIWNSATAFVSAKFVVNRDAVPATPSAIGELFPSPGADPVTVAVVNTWNAYRTLIERESTRLGIDPAVAVAILVAESNGAAFGPDGRMIIRFENHIFYDEWGKQNEARFHQHFLFDPALRQRNHHWRSDSSSAWQQCHTSQAMEWLVFDFARTLDPNAALRSISMGAPQIMGFNHQRVGFGSAQAMFNAFQADDDQQLGSLFRFLEVNGLVEAVRQGDLRRIAVVYNGSNQADTYTAIIQRNLAAFRALSGRGVSPLAAASPSEGRGAVSVSAVEVADSWKEQAREGLLTSRQIFAKAVNGIAVSTLDDAIRAAQLGIIVNTYWAQLALIDDPSNTQSILQSATGDALLRLRELAGSRGGGVLLPMTALPMPSGAAQSGRRLALCIGIDAYAQQPLAGCVADAKLWATTLVALGFDQPTLLLNSTATRNAILAAIGDLIRKSQPGDVIVIQYAGHGTQLSDVSGDESGGDTPAKDEALVPFDFLSGAYVIDDDLGEIFSAIPDGVNVTCFMDCCHSGSISRVLPAEGEPIPDERPRFIVADDAMIAAHHRYRQQLGGSRTMGSRTGGKRDIESMREVVFSACQSSEVAWESAGHGEFTLRATHLLKNGVGSLSHAVFMQQVITAFGKSPRQNPLMECASAERDRRLLGLVAV